MKTSRFLVVVVVICAGLVVFAQPPATKPAQPQKPGTATTKSTTDAVKPKEEPGKAPAAKTPEAKTDAKSTGTDESADEAAIRRSAEAFVTAYNAHDAKAVSVLFALKAEMTDENGQLLKGRTAIEQDFVQTFKEFPEGTIQVEISSVRVLTPNIAVEEGTVRGRPVPDQPENVSSYVAVHVKVDGTWLIASVSDFESQEELSPHDHLQELAWMVGDWIEEGPDAHVKSSCRWDQSGNYLLHDFVLHIPGGAVSSGTVRIGWDQLSGQFKSWAFEADGGYTEGLWTQAGDEWVVKSHGANARGEVTSATNVYRSVDRDTMTWRSRDRIAAGKHQADVPEVIVKRHAPAPQS